MTLGVHEGVVSCYEGEQSCAGGQWSSCRGMSGFSYTLAEAADVGNLALLSFSNPTGCTDNPCNAFCREFLEAPASGLRPETDPLASPLSEWVVGSLGDYPVPQVGLGITEPCHTAGDCQFNTTCTDPSQGGCSHSVCTAGNALSSSCNRCVDAVCDVDDSCCGATVACEHDPCVVGGGAPLDPGCDTCVQAVCDVDADCCNTTWDASCVALVATQCAPLGQSCSCVTGASDENGFCYLPVADEKDWTSAQSDCAIDEGWRLAESRTQADNDLLQDLVVAQGLSSAWLGGFEFTENEWSWSTDAQPFFVVDGSGGSLVNSATFESWGSGEPALDVSSRGLLLDSGGQWSGREPTDPHASICAGPPTVLSPKEPVIAWRDACVALAVAECGVHCPDVPAGVGACTARVPSRLDADCETFDLSLGATCFDSVAPQIPVCNHGQSEAPAGLRIAYLPPGRMGEPAPDLSAATDCTLSEPVPAGRCVIVSDCSGISAGDEVVINPRDGSEDPTECRFDDNWTAYQPAPCTAPLCEAAAYDAAGAAASDCSVGVDNPLSVDVAAARVVLQTDIVERHCEPDEVLWGNSCYFFETTPQIWNDAQSRCRARGAGWDLVAINFPDENIFTRVFYDALAGENVQSLIQIGYNRKGSGSFAWPDGSCAPFEPWDFGEPDGFTVGSDECTRMVTSGFGGRWADRSCILGAHPSVCEGPVADAQGSCAAGQIAGPSGDCYAYDDGPMTWIDASARCSAIGFGWHLAQVDTFDDAEFLSALVTRNPACFAGAWLDNPAGKYPDLWLPGTTPDPSEDPFLNSVGFGQTEGNSLVQKAALCQGPPVASSAPALVQVGGPTSCTSNDEYYFTGTGQLPDFTPERIQLCPLTCDEAAAQPGTRLDVAIPCSAPPQPAIETVIEDELLYVADCDGGNAQWDFLYYDAVTPADSRIELAVRTGTSEDDILAESFQQVAVARAVPEDTQHCEVDPPDCPIDLFDALDQVDPRLPLRPVLQLQVRMVPGSNGEAPLLRDWTVRFSCPPSQ